MNELVKKIEGAIKLEIISAMSSGEISTALEISERFPDLTEQQAIALLNNDEFYSLLCDNTQARMRMLYHTQAIPVLERVLTSFDNKEKLAALDRLSKLVGATRELPSIQVNLSLEDLLEQREEKRVTINLEKENGNIFEAEAIVEEVEEEDDLNFLFEEEEDLN